MKRWPFTTGIFSLSISLFSGCASDDGSDEGGDIGAPCELEEDCAAGLICDDHDGQGSCQEEHDH